MEKHQFPQEQGGLVALESIQHHTKVFVEEVLTTSAALETETEHAETKSGHDAITSGGSKKKPKVRVRITDWASI